MALLPLPLARQAGQLRVPARVGWLVPRVAIGLLLLVIAAEIYVRLTAPYSLGAAGLDYRTYAAAATRQVHGLPFYPSWETSGPYDLGAFSGAVLYPPPMLLLFVPFVWLGGFLWSAIPLAIMGGVVLYHRPGPWAWAAILAFVAFSPEVQTLYWFGTPTIWIAAFVALGTVWDWPGALVLLKPAVFPFALVGVRSRSWWVALGVLGIVSLVFLPLWIQWFEVLLNARGARANLLYALGDLPLLLIPVIASFGRTRSVPGA